MDEVAVVMVDAAGSIRYWSEGAERTFGHLAAAAVGQSLDLIVPLEYRKAHWAGFRKAMSVGAASAEGRPGPFPVLNAEGEIVTVSGTLNLIRGLNGLTLGAMVVFDHALSSPPLKTGQFL